MSNSPSVSVILTINNRPPEVSGVVADSLKLKGNDCDELIVVLDRPTPEAKGGAVVAYTDLDCSVKFIEIDGEQGWLGPARAWNQGFHAASSDLLYLISSEVVQEAGNIAKAKFLARDGDVAVFGACHNSEARNLVVGAEPGLLVSSKMPRPLGFICCLPRSRVLSIGGFDEEFMGGFWYDDDDLFLRLWRSGLDFLFDDSIHGIHLDHDRPDLETAKGQAGIKRNAELMLKKHGTVHPWWDLEKLEERIEGKLRWMHV